MRSRKKLTIGIVLVGSALVVAALPVIWEAYTDLRDQRRLDEGRALAGVYCAGCHLEPAPDILPKRSWNAVLGYMGYFLGIENIDYLADDPELARVNVSAKRDYLLLEGVLPTSPLLNESDWDALRYYYVETAPADAVPQAGKPPLRWDLPQFRIVQSDYRAEPGVTTLVHVREIGRASCRERV